MVDRDVDELDDAVDLLVDVLVDVLVAAVVERVALVVVGASVSVGRLELEGSGVLEPVDAVLTAGRVAEPAVVGTAVVGAAARELFVVPAGDPAAVVGVSGSKVRAVDAGVEPNAGTVTSGTAGGPGTREDPIGAVPETGPAVPGRAAPELAGDDSPGAPPHAANRTAAMP